MISRNVVEERSKNVVIMDVFSKLAQERILFIDDVIDSELANGIVSQLIYLDSINNNEISIYINSPGGTVYDGVAILDVMDLIKSPVKTVCTGSAMSMAAIILLYGDTRVSTKRSTIMLHQMSTLVRGRLSDISIDYKEAKRLENILHEVIKEKTNIQDIDQKLLTDWYISPKEAKELGIIDTVLNGEPLRK